MIQVDKKALYIKQGYSTGRHIIVSYNTPLMIIHDDMIITSDKKYSTTTSRHKNHIIKNMYPSYKVIMIPHKTLKDIIINEGVSLGIM